MRFDWLQIKDWQPLLLFWKYWSLTLVLLNPDMPCLRKQCRSRSDGFWRSQLIWICTVCHSVSEFISVISIKASDWLTFRSVLIYSAWQGLIFLSCLKDTTSNWSVSKLVLPYINHVMQKGCLKHYTVKPFIVAPSVKQAACIKQAWFQFPKKANLLKFICIKQAPVLSKYIWIISWVLA